ncbi:MULTISPECIES: hypothetical protein [unclassified Pseudoalteromonas]|uniref:hypothetical protein n=1 Tax=unclassified Pseudoalteromonas TaxID=194690 RepID=UPI0025B52CC0|nr:MULTISPECIES: hypothetical protein [unclassified Pseudoalteromonas]MDN3380995.1 hypothetical protein [Pseudoalteromonas sp. APC 3893]MDN3389385.1 hypothetical protein [Pseudoalteromonas sp. APC 4017]
MSNKKRTVIGRKISNTNLDTLITQGNSDSLIDSSPIDGRDIKWERVTIESQDVFNKCIKSIYNKRSLDDLSLASVLDIYHSIRSSNGNTEPVRAELVDGKYEILGGLRRAYTVSILPNTKLSLIVAKDLTEKERAHFARVMDEYAEPSFMDKAKSIQALKTKLDSNNDKEITGLELSDLLGMKKSNVYYALSYANLPKELINLFPALKYVSTPLLRELVKYNKAGYLEMIAQQFNPIEPVTLTGNETAEEISEIEEQLQKSSKKLQSELLAKIRADHSPIPVNYDGKLKEVANHELTGIKIKATKSGLNITINESKVDPVILDKLITALNNN